MSPHTELVVPGVCHEMTTAISGETRDKQSLGTPVCVCAHLSSLMPVFTHPCSTDGHTQGGAGLGFLPTSGLSGRAWDRLNVSLQLLVKDRSGASLRPRGPVVNIEGCSELGKSILASRAHAQHLLRAEPGWLSPKA